MRQSAARVADHLRWHGQLQPVFRGRVISSGTGGRHPDLYDHPGQSDSRRSRGRGPISSEHGRQANQGKGLCAERLLLALIPFGEVCAPPGSTGGTSLIGSVNSTLRNRFGRQFEVLSGSSGSVKGSVSFPAGTRRCIGASTVTERKRAGNTTIGYPRRSTPLRSSQWARAVFTMMFMEASR